MISFRISQLSYAIEMIKTGCCGFPTGMKIYFENRGLVEIQKTFYKLPKVETAKKWREMAPKEFEFTIKAWQLITHDPKSPTYRKAGITVPESEEKKYGFFKPTEKVFEAWERTRAISEALESKIIVFQCPSSFRPTPENVKT